MGIPGIALNAGGRLRLGCWMVATLLGSAAAAADGQSELNDRWQGGWVLIGVESYSDCGFLYTNNDVRGDRVSSKGDHRFAAGELARVHKVDLKRRQVRVLLDVAEPLLAPRREGPFTLYQELGCRLELDLPLPSGSEEKRTAESERAMGALLERHPGRESARASAGWNGRVREPYPEDYEETLARYEAWRVAQLNAAVGAAIEHSVERAARIVDRLEEGAEYLEGFAAGVDEARDRYLPDECERLLSMAEYSFVENAPRGSGKEWKEGFTEGQELVFHLERGRKLHRCFVPPPPGSSPGSWPGS